MTPRVTVVMSRHRPGELDTPRNAKFRHALDARGVRAITYRELIQMHGLTAMRAPQP